MRPCLHKQAGWDPSYTGGIGGLWSRANPRQEGNALSKTYAKKGWGAAQMIESLPSKSKAPSSNPSTTKKKMPHAFGECACPCIAQSQTPCPCGAGAPAVPFHCTDKEHGAQAHSWDQDRLSCPLCLLTPFGPLGIYSSLKNNLCQRFPMLTPQCLDKRIF
jgi:hypothetical protein